MAYDGFKGWPRDFLSYGVGTFRWVDIAASTAWAEVLVPRKRFLVVGRPGVDNYLHLDWPSPNDDVDDSVCRAPVPSGYNSRTKPVQDLVESPVQYGNSQRRGSSWRSSMGMQGCCFRF